jgi:hypothetical protein
MDEMVHVQEYRWGYFILVGMMKDRKTVEIILNNSKRNQ